MPFSFEGDPKLADPELLNFLEALREQGYQFTTVTPLTQARVNQRPGNLWATDLVGAFGWSRPFRRNTLPRFIVDLMQSANILTTNDDGVLRSQIRVSTLGTHMFAHSAFPTTDANSVFFGPDTVRFVQAIKRHLTERTTPVGRVVDVGCGAGPGGIFIAETAPNADVLMLDINALAIRYAQVNATFNGVNARARYSDILKHTSGSFDLIVSNPPYLIDPKARAYRHGGGKFGEGLSLKILQQSLPRLSSGGSLLLYTGTAIVSGLDRFAKACRDQLHATHFRWTYAEIDPDVFGEELEGPAYAAVDRIAAVVLTVTNESAS